MCNNRYSSMYQTYSCHKSQRKSYIPLRFNFSIHTTHTHIGSKIYQISFKNFIHSSNGKEEIIVNTFTYTKLRRKIRHVSARKIAPTERRNPARALRLLYYISCKKRNNKTRGRRNNQHFSLLSPHTHIAIPFAFVLGIGPPSSLLFLPHA